MKDDFRILHLEDSPDFSLVFSAKVMGRNPSISEIQKVGCFKEFQQELVSQTSYDLIVSDVQVPMFEGQSPQDYGFAIQGEVARYSPNTPFMFLTSDIESPFILETSKDIPCLDKRDYAGWLQTIQSFL